jgi:flagellar hook-associated protein FlgK
MKAPKPKAKGITKPDPQDAGVFTQEKLKQFGGTMRDIPQGMDGAMKKGGKVKKYADGGDIDADFGARNEGPAGDDSYTPAPKAESKTRGEAFRAARAAGDKTFEFEGKKYTTELAKPKATPAKEEAPKSVKSPGIMQRMRDKDTAMVKSAQAKTRQGNADLGAGNAGPSGTGGRLTGDRMSPAYGQGRVNPDTMLAMKKGGKVSKFASGGFVRAADGCAQRGKTKGMMR